MSNAVREKLEAYFASLNSTSGRMMADIISSREEYSDRWESMLPEEQSEILWKSIVKNDAVTKYKNIPVKTLDVEYFPVLRTRPGEKIIVEDDSASAKSFASGCTWQDEHSAPFRWETQSQLELRICDDDDDDKADKEKEKIKTLQRDTPRKLPEPEKQETKKDEEVKRHTVKRPEVPPPPVPPHATLPAATETPPVPPHSEKAEKEIPIYAKVVKRKSSTKTLMISELKAYRKAREEMKPAVPPRMSLELKGDVDISKFNVQDIDIDGIPKTGFDFLDNW